MGWDRKDARTKMNIMMGLKVRQKITIIVSANQNSKLVNGVSQFVIKLMVLSAIK